MSARIESPRVSLTKSVTKDIPRFCSFESDPDNRRWILPYSAWQHQQAIESNDDEHLTVWNKMSGEMTGFILLTGLTSPHQSLEMKRIVIGEKGRGLGRESLRLVEKYCFEEIRFHRLWLDVFDDNFRAIQFYKLQGFMQEGILRETVKDVSGYRNLIVFAKLDSDYFLKL